MITAIIIIGLAFIWLGCETQWLTVRLETGETIEQFDRRILKDIANAALAKAKAEDKKMTPALFFWNQWAMRGIPYKAVNCASYVLNGGWLDEAKYIGEISPNHPMEVYFN